MTAESVIAVRFALDLENGGVVRGGVELLRFSTSAGVCIS